MRVALVVLWLVSAVLSGVSLTRKAVQSAELQVVQAVPAIYPKIASVAEQSGSVTVEVTIKPDGSVVEAKAVDGHKLFRNSAEKSARLWVFNTIAPSQTSRSARLNFSFKLIEKKNATPEALLPIFLPPFAVETRATTTTYVFQKSVGSSTKPIISRLTEPLYSSCFM